MLSVVIFDDNKSTADMIAHSGDWKSIGCNVKAVRYDGKSGLKAIEVFKPDLIITDINMPGFNGIEMVTRSQKLVPSAKYIFITAHDNFEYAHSAIKLHAYDYLLKPFAQNELFRIASHAADELQHNMQNSTSSSQYNDDLLPLIVKKIILYIENNLSESITLELLASKFKISSSHIGKIIKQNTGIRYSDLLINLRLKKAKLLLADSRYKISEISEMVGYKNYITFYKVFMRKYDTSPNQYRNKKIN